MTLSKSAGPMLFLFGFLLTTALILLAPESDKNYIVFHDDSALVEYDSALPSSTVRTGSVFRLGQSELVPMEGN